MQGDRLGPLPTVFQRPRGAVVAERLDATAVLDGPGVQRDEALRRVLPRDRE